MESGLPELYMESGWSPELCLEKGLDLGNWSKIGVRNYACIKTSRILKTPSVDEI
jgi:hypothetical protein